MFLFLGGRQKTHRTLGIVVYKLKRKNEINRNRDSYVDVARTGIIVTIGDARTGELSGCHFSDAGPTEMKGERPLAGSIAKC